MTIANAKNFSMEMEIPEISKLKSVWSSEFLIHGIPWKIKVCKQRKDTEQSLGVYLHCANKDESPNWSLWGEASFKLLAFSDDGNPIERHISPYVFDASGRGHGTGSLIKWNDLFNQDKKYVKDDTINLEVKVTAEKPNDPNQSRLNFECIQKCCDNSYFVVVRLKVNNIVNLMAVKSPEFTLRGLPWRIQVRKKRSFLETSLSVLLELKKDSEKELCNMKMTVKLVSSKNDVQPIEKCITKPYKYLGPDKILDVVLWDEMVKPENGFVNDNSITFEVEIGTENSRVFKSNPKTEAEPLRMKCAICLESIDDQELSVTPCGHLFCLVCITRAVSNRPACPSCNVEVLTDNLRRLYLPE